ncbi:hypothetical protein QTP86_025811 [Hemibagrus guttatus]|nr:hypothetical protein QTP86_025811 [Hemibagrus guttatus]
MPSVYSNKKFQNLWREMSVWLCVELSVCLSLCLSILLYVTIFISHRWEGKNENEVGRCQETGVIHVKVDPKYYRPTEVEKGKKEKKGNREHEIGHSSPIIHHAPSLGKRIGGDYLQGDGTKALDKLGWKPRVTFEDLVKEMVDADIELMRSNPNA